MLLNFRDRTPKRTDHGAIELLESLSRSLFKVKVKNTLFNLGMVTYSYERQNIIQIALKRLPGG
jgi:hypothetical protein